MSLLLALQGAPAVALVEHVERQAIVGQWVVQPRQSLPDVEEIVAAVTPPSSEEITPWAMVVPLAIATTVAVAHELVAVIADEHAQASTVIHAPVPQIVALGSSVEEIPAVAAATFTDEPAEFAVPRAWSFVNAPTSQPDEDLPAVAVAAIDHEHASVIAPLAMAIRQLATVADEDMAGVVVATLAHEHGGPGQPWAPIAVQPITFPSLELVVIVPDEVLLTAPFVSWPVALQQAAAAQPDDLVIVPDEPGWTLPAPMPPAVGRWTPVAEEEISAVLAALAWEAHQAIGQPTLPRAGLWLQTHASEHLAGPVAPVVLSGEAAATEELAELFAVGWSSLRPGVPMALEGETFDAVDQWVRFSVIHATRHPTTFGSGARRVEVRGFAAVQLFAPANAGQGELAAMAEDARAAIDGVAGAIVTTYQGTTRRTGEDGRWITALVVVPFWYCELV